MTPDHNDIFLLNKEWEKIRYSELWEYLNDRIKQNLCGKDYLFKDFVNVLGDQASKNLNACIMERKFKNAIQKAKKQ